MNIPAPRPADRRARRARVAEAEAMIAPARRQRHLLQGRAAAHLCRRARVRGAARRRRQEGLPRRASCSTSTTRWPARSPVSPGMGMTFLTIHAYPQAMRAAVKARGASPLKLLAVTVLTSHERWRPCRSRLRRRRQRPGRAARRHAGAPGIGRHRRLAGGGRGGAPHRRAGCRDRDAGHPPGGHRGRRPEAGRRRRQRRSGPGPTISSSGGRSPAPPIPGGGRRHRRRDRGQL